MKKQKPNIKKKVEVVVLDKYGVFNHNEDDIKQIKEMLSKGYELLFETTTKRTWVKK